MIHPRTWPVSAVLTAILTFVALGVLADVRIHDVQTDPRYYEEKMVEFEGKILRVQPGKTEIFAAVYALQDLDGDEILVRTSTPPEVGQKVRARGIVSIDKLGNVFLDERDRRTIAGQLSQQSFSSIPREYVIGAAVVFALILLFVVAAGRRPNTVQPQAAQPASTAMPATVPPPAASQSSVGPAPVAQQGRTPTMRVREPARQPTVAYLDGLRATLTVAEGPSNVGNVYPILKKETTIGRTGDVRLPDDHLTVSNEHAKITYEGEGKFRLTHLSHTNATKVNDESVTDSRALNSGDVIQLGATKLRFENQAVAASG